MNQINNDFSYLKLFLGRKILDQRTTPFFYLQPNQNSLLSSKASAEEQSAVMMIVFSAEILNKISMMHDDNNDYDYNKYN